MTEKETLIPVSVEELAALEVLATKTLYLLKGPKSGWEKNHARINWSAKVPR